MRQTVIGLVLLSLIGSAAGADLRVGTWKLNFAKSQMPAGSPEESLKEETLAVREVNGNLEVVSTGVSADGSPFASKYAFPIQGGIAQFPGGDSGKGFSTVFTVIDAHTTFVTYLLNGKQVAVIQSVVSKDGRSFQNTTRGVDAQGRSFERVTLFEKQ